MTITRAIREIHAIPDGWVVVESVSRADQGLIVSLAVRKGKTGQRLGSWEIRCRGVRELQISDLSGGGIRLYASGHPAANQFVSPMVRLSCATGDHTVRALGTLAAAHLAATDDWIPVERYLPLGSCANGRVAVRAPAFLARVYVRALRKAGFGVRLSPRQSPPRSRKHPRVLHLGNSFVIADAFEVRSGLANNEMQRTKHR